MPSIIRYATIVVSIHTIVVGLHGLAHARISVPLSQTQSLFVGSIIVFAPIAALSLLWASLNWTVLHQVGRWMLLSSMLGALLFGIYYHFIVVSSDHISQIPLTSWGILFHVTAILLILIEGFGCFMSGWGLAILQRREQRL